MTPREISEDERWAILALAALAAANGADRRELMLALRGARSGRLRALGLVGAAGHGQLATQGDEEVLARIDTLIQEGALRVEWSEDGRPLLRVTE